MEQELITGPGGGVAHHIQLRNRSSPVPITPGQHGALGGKHRIAVAVNLQNVNCLRYHIEMRALAQITMV
jgi:hypothetical protein